MWFGLCLSPCGYVLLSLCACTLVNVCAGRCSFSFRRQLSVQQDGDSPLSVRFMSIMTKTWSYGLILGISETTIGSNVFGRIHIFSLWALQEVTDECSVGCKDANKFLTLDKTSKSTKLRVSTLRLYWYATCSENLLLPKELEMCLTEIYLWTFPHVVYKMWHEKQKGYCILFLQ